MIVILIIFLLLLIAVALSKNYFTGYIKELFNGSQTVMDDNKINDLINRNRSIRNEPSSVKINKLINKDLVIQFEKPENTNLFAINPGEGMCVKDFKLVNDPQNLKWRMVHNLSNNPVDVSFYHPNSKSYLFNDNGRLNYGSLNIIKGDNRVKASFKLVYDTSLFDLTSSSDNDKLNGIFYIAHTNSKGTKYLAIKSEPVNENSSLMLVDNLTEASPVRIFDYNILMTDRNRFNKSIIEKVNEEHFGSVPNSSSDRKTNVMTMLLNKLISKTDAAIESFSNGNGIGNNNLKEQLEYRQKFNTFEPHLHFEFKNLLNSYGKNLYADELTSSSIQGDNIVDYLKNYNMRLINKNNELQHHIDTNSIEIDTVLDKKHTDLHVLKLAQDSLAHYSLN